jgi:hypothetical protein
MPHNHNKIFKKNSVALVCKQTIPTEPPPLVGEVSTIVPTFVDRECRVVSATDPHDR